MLDLRLIPEARRAADQALREFTVTNVPLMQGEAQLRVARVALLADDLAVADDAAGRAVVSFRRQQRTGWAARAVVVRTEARLQSGSVTREDLQHVRRAATTLERLAHTAEAVEGHHRRPSRGRPRPDRGRRPASTGRTRSREVRRC